MLCGGVKKESDVKSLKEGDIDGNRVRVALVSTVTVDGEVPGMKVEGKQTSPTPMATAQQLVLVSCEDRKGKNITRSPSSPGDKVRCCIRKQEAGQNQRALTNMHTHARTHTIMIT